MSWKTVGMVWLGAVISQSLALAQDDCKLKKDKDGIKVYACHNDTSTFKSIKAEVLIPSITPDQLATFLLDIDNYATWQYNMTESKVLKREHDTKMIYRTVIDAPWPVTNRELIAQFDLTRDSTRNTISILQKSIAYDYPRDEDLVLVPFSEARWQIREDKNNVHITYSLQVDPGGSIPVWLVNMAIAEGPFSSFKNLKEQLYKRTPGR